MRHAVLMCAFESVTGNILMVSHIKFVLNLSLKYHVILSVKKKCL